MKQKMEIEVDVPDGYELTGENGYCGYSEENDGLKSLLVRCKVRRVKRYRPPVLPADWGKQCEGLNCDGEWVAGVLLSFFKRVDDDPKPWLIADKTGDDAYVFDCRIEVTE